MVNYKNYKNIEMREKSGIDNYDTILYPVTTTENVIYKQDISVDDEITTILKTLKDCKTVSTTHYEHTLPCENSTVLEIKSPDYHYLDSQLDIYYNGLYLIPDINYVLEDLNKIRFLDFELQDKDQVTFKVYNSIKINLDLDFKGMTESKAKHLHNLNNSINNYVNFVNRGKELIAKEFQNGNIDINWNNTFEEMAQQVKVLVDSKKSMPTDLGILFSNPYFGLMSTINLGRLFGNSLTSEDFTSDLGNLFGVN